MTPSSDKLDYTVLIGLEAGQTPTQGLLLDRDFVMDTIRRGTESVWVSRDEKLRPAQLQAKFEVWLDALKGLRPR